MRNNPQATRAPASYRRLALVAVAAVTLIASIAGVSTASGKPNSSNARSASDESVTYLLSFVPDAQFVNAYLASDLGYTKTCHLNLKLQHLNGSQNAAQLLATGKVQYAQLDPFQYEAAVAKGVPIVAIAEDIAQTPFVFLTLAKSGIKSAKDFPGHTVGTQAGADNQWYLEKMLSDSVSPKDAKRVKQVPAGFDLQPFLAGKIDVFPFFAADATLAAAQQKTKINEIFAADYGIHTPGNIIATTLKTLKNNPTQVKRFLAAEMAGTQASTQAANRANGIRAVKDRIGAKVSDKILGKLYNEWGKYRSSPAWSKNGPGWNVLSSYDQAQQFLLQHGVLKEKLPAAKLFTNSVLQQVESRGKVKPLTQVCG